MLKKVKRHRKRRANRRHKKEKWFDEMLRRQLFEYYCIEAFFERRRKEHLSKVFPSGGVTNTNIEVVTPATSPDVILTTTRI